MRRFLLVLLFTVTIPRPLWADETTFTDDFEGGANTGLWALIAGADTLETSGGNPGWWLRNSFYNTFAPIATGTASPFSGDFRAMGVNKIEVDARTDFVSIGAAGFEFSLLLRDTKGTGDPNDDDYAYFVGPEVPQPGAGWKSFSFNVPSAATVEVPPGWSGGWAGNPVQFRPGVTWSDVIVSVDQVELWWLDPSLFAIFQVWDVGIDNVRITTGAAPGTLNLAAGGNNLSAGDPLSLTTCGGESGTGVLLSVVDVNSVPIFYVVDFDTFDGNGESTFAATVPPGLAGFNVTFLSFGKANGASKVASNLEVITFL